MRLDRYLVERGYTSTRSKALHLIKTGRVKVNGEVIIKQSYRVKEGDVVEVEPFRYVGRGGYKMEALFSSYPMDLRGKDVLDVGCSTGGFTHFFLIMGARVIGTDTAEDVVSPELFKFEDFCFIGGVDATSKEDLRKALNGRRFHIISVDLTGVSLRKVLPHLREYLTPDGRVIALFKPPYESGKIADKRETEEMVREFSEMLSLYETIHRMISPYRGGADNRGTCEAFLVLRPADIWVGTDPPWNHGIYILLMKLDKEIKSRFHLPPAYYAYVGSAQKNLRARLNRHTRRGKRMRWHVDILTEVAEHVAVFSSPLPRWCEDEVAGMLEEKHRSIPGFGATDSRVESHLFLGNREIIGSARSALVRLSERLSPP